MCAGVYCNYVQRVCTLIVNLYSLCPGQLWYGQIEKDFILTSLANNNAISATTNIKILFLYYQIIQPHRLIYH